MDANQSGSRTPVPAIPAKEVRALKPLLNKVKKLILFDAIIVGVGHRNDFGEVVVDGYYSEGLEREFIDNYGQVAPYDAAAQLFMSNTTSVFAITTREDYFQDPSSDAAKVGKYLLGRKIAHLLLSGIDSSRGLAWVTLYRTDVPPTDEVKEPEQRPKFMPMECELASYVIRAGLYEWQMACNFEQRRMPDAKRYALIPLSPAELDVAVRAARGYSIKQIYKELDVGESTVKKHLTAMTDQGLNPSNIAKRLMGDLPPARLRRGKKPGPPRGTKPQPNRGKKPGPRPRGR